MSDGYLTIAADEVGEVNIRSDGGQGVYGVERVHLGFDEDGYLTDCERADCREAGEHVEGCDYAGESFPAGVTAWCNSAAISVDDDEDTVTVSISVGDPRGAFVMVMGRRDGGLFLSVPDPLDGFLHMPLDEIRSGYFHVGGR